MIPGEKTVDIHSEQHHQVVVIGLVGSLDAVTANEARMKMQRQIDEGALRIVLDLSRVDFMSSAGVRVLLEILKRIRQLDGDLRLAAAQSSVEKTLEILGLVRVLKIYPSVAEAVHDFAASP
jgi:anti-sigma B factor antagonist